MAQLPLPIIADSGAPHSSPDYSTIVLFHGYAWSSDAFRKMLPLAKASNARLILANRRDYAAATPYTARERADLFAAAAVAKTEPDAARPRVLAWMQDRAREVYELLVHIVAEHKIPLAYPDAKTGGITVGGWSFGTTLMTALLANLASFPVGEVDLRKYLRRVVFLDPPEWALGLPRQTPMPDIDTPPTGKQRINAALFYSAYFRHGDVDDPATYPLTMPLPDAEALPTWRRLTTAEIEAMYDPVPGDVRGGTDSTLVKTGMSTGAFYALREGALRLPDSESQEDGSTQGWDAVEVRHVWGDHSLASMLWAVQVLRAELEKERKAGRRVRNVSFVRVEGGNHFMSWDLPEKTMEAILGA